VAVLGVFALGRASTGGRSGSSVPSPRSAIPGAGPTRTVSGVPTGYAHTRAGAMAAALNYIGVVGNPAVLLDVRRLRQVLSVLATPQLARRVLAGYGPAAARLGQSRLVRSLRSGTPAIAIGVPVAYRVVRRTGDRLTVQFWTVGVVGDVQGTEPHAIWQRTTATFGWVGGDWKLIAPLEHDDGPTPAPPATGHPTDASAFIASLRGFRSFRYAP
jgi:hypothetical protein